MHPYVMWSEQRVVTTVYLANTINLLGIYAGTLIYYDYAFSVSKIHNLFCIWVVWGAIRVGSNPLYQIIILHN